MFHPGHLTRALRLHIGRRKHSRARDDLQLELFSSILPGGFLHYGYFDDPDIAPEEVSLADLARAQRRYAELLVELADDRSAPVLDVGCGMGGLSSMLLERGYLPTALTPDATQARHIRQHLAQVPLIHSKLEDLPGPELHEGRFGTLFTSESLQYLKLPRALPLLRRILSPGGRWIACDMFRTGDSRGRGGHNWNDFLAQVCEQGWEITWQRDITAHVMPTMRVMEMLVNRAGIPVLRFGIGKLQHKQPGLHYLLGGALGMLDEAIEQNMKMIRPADFMSDRKYLMLVLKQSRSQEQMLSRSERALRGSADVAAYAA